jgi:hypothetical protein
MPVRIRRGMQRPANHSQGEAGTDCGVLGDVGVIVVVNEIVLPHWAVECDRSDSKNRAAKNQARLLDNRSR